MKIHPLGLFQAAYHVFKPQNAKSPGHLCPREIGRFLPDFFSFSGKFHTFSQHLLTKKKFSEKPPQSPLQNPIFIFFISLLVPEIFRLF